MFSQGKNSQYGEAATVSNYPRLLSPFSIPFISLFPTHF